MAALYNWCAEKLGKEIPHHKIVMLGDHGAGKTTMLYRLLLGKLIDVMPSIGFNVEEVRILNTRSTIWDIGGGRNLAGLWHWHVEGSDGVVVVVDSTYDDRENWETFSKNLHALLTLPECLNKPVLVFANKQDLRFRDGSAPMSALDVVEKLSLRKLPQRHWTVQLCSAHTWEGIMPGFKWLINAFSYPDLQEPTEKAEEVIQETSTSTTAIETEKRSE